MVALSNSLEPAATTWSAHAAYVATRSAALPWWPRLPSSVATWISTDSGSSDAGGISAAVFDSSSIVTDRPAAASEVARSRTHGKPSTSVTIRICSASGSISMGCPIGPTTESCAPGTSSASESRPPSARGCSATWTLPAMRSICVTGATRRRRYPPASAWRRWSACPARSDAISSGSRRRSALRPGASSPTASSWARTGVAPIER